MRNRFDAICRCIRNAACRGRCFCPPSFFAFHYEVILGEASNAIPLWETSSRHIQRTSSGKAAPTTREVQNLQSASCSRATVWYGVISDISCTNVIQHVVLKRKFIGFTNEFTVRSWPLNCNINGKEGRVLSIIVTGNFAKCKKPVMALSWTKLASHAYPQQIIVDWRELNNTSILGISLWHWHQSSNVEVKKSRKVFCSHFSFSSSSQWAEHPNTWNTAKMSCISICPHYV